MSVLIKGMEMPSSCNACMFDVYGLCLINKNIEGEDELTHSCPLVPVPPHGRLIDADALDNTLGIDDRDNYVHWTLEDAPTIIPAEEGER